jgi:septal ring factor EnvC (AmiA/AmiB activator)
VSWLQRHASWLWLAALVVSAVLVASLRMDWGPSGPPQGAEPADTGGVVAAEPSNLAAVARRIQLIQGRAAQLREQLATLQTEGSARRREVAALNDMLAADSFTECPSFLSEDTTVRALQKIIREAAGAADSGAPDYNRLHTAATVARERLRTRLEVLRDQLSREADDLSAQSEDLRQRLLIQSEEAERLDRQVREELRDRSPPPAVHVP